MNGASTVFWNNFSKAVFWQVDDKISWVFFAYKCKNKKNGGTIGKIKTANLYSIKKLAVRQP